MSKFRPTNRRFNRRIRANSKSLVKWAWWMVLDVLESRKWGIEYRYVYYDRKKKLIIVKERRISNPGSRFQRPGACVDPDEVEPDKVESDEGKIFIDPEAEDKALCLFHECLEIIFADWKDRYFVPGRWGLEKGADPINYLEAASWDKLSNVQKKAIAKYLPKEP